MGTVIQFDSNNVVVINTLTAPVPTDRMSFFANIEYK